MVGKRTAVAVLVGVGILFGKVDAQNLPVPQIDSVSVTADNRICVGWHVESTVNVERFVIYRKKADDFAYIPIDTLTSNLPWLWFDNNANPLTERWYYSIASLSAGDSISGLAAAHSYLMLTPDEYDICNHRQQFNWTYYIGATPEYFELVCEHNLAVVDHSTLFSNSGNIRLLPGRENRVYVRGYWNGKSTTSATLSLIPDTLQIAKHVAIRSIENRGENFMVTVQSTPSRDRKEIFVHYFFDDNNPEIFRQSVSPTDAEAHFSIPVIDPKGSFSTAISDICDTLYTNPTKVQAIWLSLTERPNGVFLRWNFPQNTDNMLFTVYYNDGVDHIAEQSFGLEQFYLAFSPSPISSPEICFRVAATNDTLTIISNQQCIQTEEDLRWPNAFVPDGDGFDETFRPVPRRFYPEKYELRIYDKKGKLLFVSNSIDIGWNGIYEGDLVPLGAYIWQATYTIAGKKYNKQGSVNIFY